MTLPARAVLALAFLLWTTAAYGEDRAGIQVTGRGEAGVEPDIARVQFQVVRQGGDAAAVKQQLDDVVRGVLTLTDRLRIEQQDVTAAVIQVSPNYRHQNGRTIIDGVVAQRQVKVILRNLEHYQALIDGLLEAGINQIHHVELDHSDPHALQRRALDLAIDDALHEARAVAERFGMRLGTVLEINVDPRPVQHFPVSERIGALRAAEDAVRPGRISVERSVRVRFALLEGRN
jgi:uncharacterized protein